MSKTYREESRKDWYREEGLPTTDQLKLGCLQRIADATETMARRYSDLLYERDDYKKRYEGACLHNDASNRRIAALRGVITKLKKKLEARR
jgi:hypothetical protein